MTDSFELTTTFPVPPEVLFDAWIDPNEHEAMTGAGATSEPITGGAFSAWDGYIDGHHQLLERPRRLIQTWRTSEFPASARDSRVELTFERDGEGTRVHLVHTEIPPGQGQRYAGGWEEFYFAPMRKYFTRAARR